jgi:hypothetical protein
MTQAEWMELRFGPGPQEPPGRIVIRAASATPQLTIAAHIHLRAAQRGRAQR